MSSIAEVSGADPAPVLNRFCRCLVGTIDDRPSLLAMAFIFRVGQQHRDSCWAGSCLLSYLRSKRTGCQESARTCFIASTRESVVP